MDKEYDVVVVGAGPSGSVTARYAAAGGCNVLMIEKRQEIGSPVRCGEGIARHFLDECDIKFDRRWVACEVQGAKVVSPSGIEFTIDERYAGTEVGIVLERDAFDKALAKDAARAGADIWVKTTAVGLVQENGRVAGVRVQRLNEEFNVRAKVVVAADGFESQVGRWAGINTLLKAGDITGTLQYRLTNIEADTRYCEFFLGSIAPGGYVWIFPKDEESGNVGLGITLTHLKSKMDLKKYLDRFCRTNPRLRHGQMLDMVTGGVSTSPPLKETVRDGIVLVGDAARMIDPITGGGIGNGCRAGMLLGKILSEAKESGDWSLDQLMKYERGWRAWMEEGLYRNWLAKKKLLTLNDQDFDDLIGLLADAGVEKLSVHAILKVVKERKPELVERFMDLI
jgi:digeranylgeranylglycerophospholipid reductase